MKHRPTNKIVSVTSGEVVEPPEAIPKIDKTFKLEIPESSPNVVECRCSNTARKECPCPNGQAYRNSLFDVNS